VSIPLFGKMAKQTHVITDTGVRPLTAFEKVMVLILADEQGRRGPYVEVSMDDLAHWCRYSPKTVMRVARGLEADKVLKVDRPAVSAFGHKFRYVIDEDRLCWKAPTLKGDRLTPLKGDRLSKKGRQTDTLNHTSLPSTIPFTGTGTKIPSSNLVEVDSERAVLKRTRAREKTNGKTQLDLEAIEGLLMQGLKRVDPQLAGQLADECLAENPDVTTEQMLFVLNAIFAEGIPAHIKRPAGFVRRAASARVRKSYLDALDAAARERMRAAGREPEPRTPDPEPRKVN
jgi:hypothetical protein